MARRKAHRRTRDKISINLPLLLAFCAFLVGLAVGRLWYILEVGQHRTEKVPVSVVIKEEKTEQEKQVKHVPEVKLSIPKVSKERPKAVIAVIIDDIGNRLIDVERFSSIPYPVTLSIIPFTPFDLYSANYAHAHGKTVMLHIPMEPNHTGEKIEKLEKRTKGMLKTSMTTPKIEKLLLKEIGRIKYAVAANNHMGSRFTADLQDMRVVLSVLKQSGLFFVDSLTTSKSVACRVGRQLGVVVLRRDVFLDNSEDAVYIEHQLDHLARIALRRGYAIAIGHPHLVTYKALVKKLPELEKRGIKVVPIDYIYRGVLEGWYEGCV